MARSVEIIPGIRWVGCGSWGGVTPVLSAEGSGNVFLVGGKDESALIDAGTPDSVDAMLANCREAGCPMERITRVVITHAHPDHMFGVNRVTAGTGAKVVSSPLTAAALSGDAAAIERLFLNHWKGFEQAAVDAIVNEGHHVNLGGGKFRGLLTPGHIPDALCLIGTVNGIRVLFTGDTAIGDQAKAKGVVGWLDGHWGSNPKHLLKSIDKLMACDADLILAGHGEPIRGRDAVRLSLEHCRERVEQLLAIEGLHTMMPLDLEE